MPVTMDLEVFKAFAFYGSLVLAKTLIMSFLTARQRFAKKVFANPEDARRRNGVTTPDDDVERVRRAHLNDIENIYPFVLLGLIYCFTQPNYQTALWHFRIFTGARFMHTLVYLNELQPWRLIAFVIGTFVNLSLIGQIISKTL